MSNPLGSIEGFVAGAVARARAEVAALGEDRVTPSFKDVEVAIAGALKHLAEAIGLESEAPAESDTPAPSDTPAIDAAAATDTAAPAASEPPAEEAAPVAAPAEVAQEAVSGDPPPAPANDAAAG